MSRVPTYAVIPTYQRWGWLYDCIGSLHNQVEHFIVLDNNDVEMQPGEYLPKTTVVPYAKRPPNISEMWNIGIDFFSTVEDTEWNILIVNDDVVCPDNLVFTLETALRDSSAALAYPNQFTDEAILHTVAKPTPFEKKIAGFCFMLRGEQGLRLDESLVWWFGDDDLDWTCRQLGGSYMVPGCRVEHRDPDGNTKRNPLLTAQAVRDQARFKQKWGRIPV